ncbi:MAG: alanine--tRNA ligase [Candidatus Zambryskibacteria bacterium]|nr:alanine--tRNA ligase [Candidatus Zambryskibacteria bacterium]
MTSAEIRKRFLDFFEKRGHSILPSASLVPENDPSVLFNTAGMQPLVPYLLGEKHPNGSRLADVQKCVRTNDIDEVGDNTHLTFFEMMGNWSLGDYWKKESIQWSYDLLTSLDEGFGLNPQRLYVTCFEGDSNAPKDEESAQIWEEIFKKNGVTGERIYFRPKEKNWWSAGDNGPCGPDTEMFYDLTGDLDKGMTLEEYLKADESQKVVEIWNNVFMEYLSKDGKVVEKLQNRNVDTGSGFERVVAVIQGKNNVFDTDLFTPITEHLRENPSTSIIKSERIIADHVRTAIFLIADGVVPSNTDRGYILRRLIRRAVRHADLMKLPPNFLPTIIPIVEEIYKDIYPYLKDGRPKITSEITQEEERFRKTLSDGMKQFQKLSTENISGEEAFTLFSTYGFPIELIQELAKEKNIKVDVTGFNNAFRLHQKASRVGAEEKFKGGLAGTGEMEIKYHTATHLLHQALRDVLGKSVTQKGSNITSERLRFDFAFERKMTDDEKMNVQNIVNEKIQAKLPVQKVTMKKEDAEKTGALHFFGDKYGEEVNVYFIGEKIEEAYSKEYCGGPHTENTGSLGKFIITKEEAVSAGVRRIKAILE